MAGARVPAEVQLAQHRRDARAALPGLSEQQLRRTLELIIEDSTLMNAATAFDLLDRITDANK